MDAEHITVHGAESNGDGPSTPERPCADCAAARAAAETADARAALWQGVGIGAFIAAGLVVAAVIILLRRAQLADEAGE